MLPEKRLELVHFQITKMCNLHCWFCGQWGSKGFFSDSDGSPMTYADWERVTASLSRVKPLPSVILWGGEPLVSPDFGKIVSLLHTKGFELGIVTNGVFIDKWADILKSCFKVIYVSIDGPENIHDKIRGKGVYKKVMSNLKLLSGGNAKLVIMSVMSPELSECIESFADELESVKPHELYLQDMISLEKSEADAYADWLYKSFGQKANEIYSWNTKGFSTNEKTVSKHSFNIVYKKHGEKAENSFCLSPFRHAHIAWNGSVMYCTDFYDFSAGNVKTADIIDIFNNDLSEIFRNEVYCGNCPSCAHCSWKNNKTFYL